MLYLSVKLRHLKKLSAPSTAIVTDRIDLNEQITNTFRRCGFPNLRLTKSAQNLRDLLRTATGAIIMTAIQRFQDHVGDGSDLLLNDTGDIFVLIDESHRVISANNNDRLKKYHLTKEKQKHYIERFRKPLHEDRLAFIIVCDMLRTGVDAPT
jgi:type I site-specific restriction-modification system R (restriction) subunit